MGYLTFVLVLLGIIILIMFFQYINSRKSDKLYLLKLNESFGSKDRSSYDRNRLISVSDYYTRNKTDLYIDDITWSDLNMDDIFAYMDTTQSDIGSQLLYSFLRNPLTTADDVDSRFQKVAFWKDNAEIRNKILLELHHIGRVKKFSVYQRVERLTELKTKSVSVYYFRILLLLASVASIFFLKGVGVLIFIGVLISNLISYYKDKAEVDSFVAVFRHVLNILDCAGDIRKYLSACEEYTWDDDCEKPLNELKGFRRRGGLDRGLDQGGNPFIGIVNLVGMLFFLDLIRFWKLKDELVLKKDNVYKIITFVGSLDAYIALADLYTQLGDNCAKPSFITQKEYLVKDIYHPLLDNPVTNSIQTSESILLTGSNASGKSTFLRSLGVAAIMSQTCGFVCAKEYKAPLFYISSAMSLKDDVCAGDSYYMAEIKAVKRMLDIQSQVLDAGLLPLCFLDELLNGTNTEERIAASTQILDEMVKRGALVFAATHDIELTNMLDSYTNYHFEEDLSDGDVKFSYKLMSGGATTRNAIRLLSAMGYSKGLVEEAEAMVNRHLTTGMWSK